MKHKRTKTNNPVAKFDFNRASVHGKSIKTQRNSINTRLNRIKVVDEDDSFEELYEDYHKG